MTALSSLPIVWGFSNLTNGTYGWTAAAYVVNFLAGFLVAFVEFGAYIAYLFGENELLGWYTATVGYWGSMYGMLLPAVFATL